jgi:hypothetical protein
MHGAEIIIYNYEVSDLEDLDVEVFSKTAIMRNGVEIDIPVERNNRSFEIIGDKKVPYDQGTKGVLIASGKDNNALFHTQVPEPDTVYEHYDNADRATYDIVIRIKGKIEGRSIYPKKVKGRLEYTRTDKIPIPAIRDSYVLATTLSRMAWVKHDVC